MKPAGASSSDADRSRTDDEKRALIQEYDEADYKGRYAVLDREQLTIRHIGRWRTETRGANLRVAGARTTPRPARKPAPTPAAAEPAPPAPEPVVLPVPEPPVVAKPPVIAKPAAVAKPAATAKAAPAAKPPPAPKVAPTTKRAAAKSAAVTPAAPKTAQPARRNDRTTTVTEPAAPRRVATGRRATTPPVRATPPAPPAPTSRRTKVVAETPVEIPRRQRRRTAAVDVAATALRDAALAHSDQIRQHAEALQKMVADEAWQTVTATAGPSAPDTDVLLEQIKVAEHAADVLRDQLAAAKPHAVSTRQSDPAAHRGRKPWWGATSE